MYRERSAEWSGLTTISPSVFHGPMGTKSASADGAGHAGRMGSLAAADDPMPQPSIKLQPWCAAAWRMPR